MDLVGVRVELPSNTPIALLRERPAGTVTLCPIGPLTNVALALVKAPEIVARLREIVLMGGAIGLGNATPAAEFNVFVDPHAADVVFRAGAPLVMCPLELTHQAPHQGGEGLNREVADARLLLEQPPVDRAGYDRDFAGILSLHPRWIQEVIEKAVQSQHASIARLHEVESCLRAIGSDREHAEAPVENDVGT